MAIPSATDVNTKVVYLNMQNKERNKINILNNKLNRILDNKEKTYNWILAHKEDIYKIYQIDLDNYKIEFAKQEYNTLKSLETKVLKLLRYPDDREREYIIQLAKWCSILKNEVEILYKIKVCSTKINMSYKEYQKYIFDYYCKVHKVLLQGDAYKFGKGFGTIFLRTINFQKGHRSRVDFAKTKENRKKLLAEGKKLYNRKEAENAEILGEEYDGVEYVEFQTKTKEVVLDIANSKYFNSRGRISFSAKSYINRKYRGMNFEEIIKKFCPTEESVSNLQTDLYTKRSILGIMNPGITLKFNR